MQKPPPPPPPPPYGYPQAPYSTPYPQQYPQYVQQPVQYQPAGYTAPVNTGPREFTHSLFSCCDDPAQCLLVWCLGCIPYGRTQSIVETGSDKDWVMWCVIYSVVAYFTGAACLLEVMTRMNLRKKYNIEGSFVKDILLALYCLPCIMQQEARETGQTGCSGPSPAGMA
eukprot:TRINITY_DN6710_c0_g1_i1.p1 TRINITY_DN6710_c0_g1~~TRINITY_DN6710_c0_g1_i1.p1  ORF type:complete len:169 (-),score=19.45 TRINITY_DN6710_c0_g1_i1:68-574(-)